MTVLTKASDMGRKPEVHNASPVEPRVDIECVATARARNRSTRVWVYRSHCNICILWLTFLIAVTLLGASILGLMYINQLNVMEQSRRYKGFCAIPIDVASSRNQATPAPARMPLRWSEEPEVTVFTNADERFASEAVNNLLERFDIDDNVEKISVYNSGHNVEFIHDFNANATGIVDQQRCFVMALDHETVLRPSVFVLSIQRGEPFDLMRVKARARALLPPAPARARAPAAPARLTAADAGPHAGPPAAPADLPAFSAVFMEKCVDRPTYRLQKEEGTIRKRSTDDTKPDYMHFAGKHVLEISIENLPELLEFEKKQAA